MDPAAPRDADDRLVAVGRALAQSLLAGHDLTVPDRHDRPTPTPAPTEALTEAPAAHAAPPSADTVPAPTPDDPDHGSGDLRTQSYIPPPADVEPGVERMEPPRRRRRSVFEPAPAEWSGPTAAGAHAVGAEPLEPVDVEDAVHPAAPTEPPPAAELDGAADPVPEIEPSPQVARVRPPEPTWTEPTWTEPTWTEPDLAGSQPFGVDPGAAWLDADRRWPEGPAWTAADPSPAEEPFDPHAQELFESLPWAKEDPADHASPGRGRRRRRRGADPAAAAPTPAGETHSATALVPVPFDAPPEAGWGPTVPELASVPLPAPMALAPAPARAPAPDGPPRLDGRPVPSAPERVGASSGLSPVTAAGWIADHPVLERPDESTVRLLRAEDDDASSTAPTPGRTVLEWATVLGSAVVVALLVKLFVIQSFSIPSESMYPTLKIDDRVVVNQLAYDVGSDVARFDVIVFRRVEGTGPSRPDDPEFLIKRVIGLPGETVEARGGIVYVNGKPLDEAEHLGPEVVTNNITQPVEVPQGHYWVMGDNRERSGDSRIFGPVPRDHIVGRAMAVWWPFDRAGSL